MRLPEASPAASEGYPQPAREYSLGFKILHMRRGWETWSGLKIVGFFLFF